jgi:hypothetical protein
MRKNLYDSDKLIIIIHEEQHKYQAKFIGKCLSFSKDVCVPLPRWQHFHLFEHNMMPAMWNDWFIQHDNHQWLEYGWTKNLDFAQKQGYLNTLRTQQVDTMLESNLFGVMAIRVDKVDQEAITEMCLIFPRAKIIAITPNMKLKEPFGFNTYKQVDPQSISPYDVTWQHGMDQWISNRQMTMKSISQHLGISLIQSELYAMFNKAGEHLPGYKSSGHWGRFHLLRMTLQPESTAMFRLTIDGMVNCQEKIKTETDYYFEIIANSPITDIKIEQFNQSHADMYNPLHIMKFTINDQDVMHGGIFYPTPPAQIRGKYNAKELLPQKIPNVACEGYWQIKTDGINVLT